MTETTTIAIVSASAALGGVLLSSLTAWGISALEARRARHQLSREKLEELSLLLVESLDWMEEATSARTLEELSSSQQCPEVQQAASIALLYFPELYKPIVAYSNDMIHMHNFLVEVFEPFRDSTSGADAARNPHFEHNVNELRKSRQAVLNEIEKVAPKYTKA